MDQAVAHQGVAQALSDHFLDFLCHDPALDMIRPLVQ